MTKQLRRELQPERPGFEMVGILLSLQIEAGVLTEIPDTKAQAAAMIGALREDREKMREGKS